MSSDDWLWGSASATSLPLSDIDCYLLLDDTHADDFLNNFALSTSKVELPLPSSPLSQHIGYSSPASLYPTSPDTDHKPSRAELASNLLSELEGRKEENFSDWLEEKVELPIFEQLPPTPPSVALAPPLYTLPPAAAAAHPALAHDTQALLREFETVYGAVELTHLTPPHSPPAPAPGPATQLLLTLQAPYASHPVSASYHPAPPPAPPVDSHWIAALPQPDYESEMAIVDELVRHTAAFQYTPTSPSSPASPASPASSRSTSLASSGDEEWSAPPRSPRAKPYSRNNDDRRWRKKEQNKNAATRYRQKKKAEVEVLLGEEYDLRQRHDQLDTKCSDLQREIRYLKGLMRDLFKAKGLIK